jgi:cytoskeletal protein CcmA (bactofilin family)
MFGIKSEKDHLGRSVEKFESIVGSSLKVQGDLVISKSLRIDGTVHGNILQAEGASATVAIAAGASVLGNVCVHDVIVSGMLKGNITSPGRVELIDTAKVEGDVTYGSIGVAVGARITGQLKQIDEMSQSEALGAISKASKAVTLRD